MGRALDANKPPTPAVAVTANPAAVVAAPPTGYRFSMIMTEDLQDTADRLARKIRRLNGGSAVARSDLVRALLILAADDQALTEQLAREIRAAKTQK